MKKTILFALFLFHVLVMRAQQDVTTTKAGEIQIIPVTHGSLVLEYRGKTIYIDAYNGADSYKEIKKPDLILITDIHGDHLDKKTLKALDLSNAAFIVPSAVEEELEGFTLPDLSTLANGEETVWENIKIEAIPMYNLPETEDSRHPKGRGNGYVLTFDDKRIYLSGDTEDIPEMRALRDIDVAFVCMNLPYTMSIEQAADAVLAFKPNIVYPYHYRGPDGLSDVEAFKLEVETQNSAIEVRLAKWYDQDE